MRTRARSRWLCRESWAIMHLSDTRTHRRHAWRPRLQRTAQGQLTPEPYPITGSIWSHSNFKERVGDSKGQWHISRWYSGVLPNDWTEFSASLYFPTSGWIHPFCSQDVQLQASSCAKRKSSRLNKNTKIWSQVSHCLVYWQRVHRCVSMYDLDVNVADPLW